MEEAVHDLVLPHSLVAYEQQVLPQREVLQHVLQDAKVLLGGEEEGGGRREGGREGEKEGGREGGRRERGREGGGRKEGGREGGGGEG